MEIRHAQADQALEEITIVKETATPSSQEDDVEDPVAKAEFDAVLGQVSARLDARAERALRARKEGRTTPFPK